MRIVPANFGILEETYIGVAAKMILMLKRMKILQQFKRDIFQ